LNDNRVNPLAIGKRCIIALYARTVMEGSSIDLNP
jgi:hypothetical protein